MLFPYSFFHAFRDYVVHSYSSTYTGATWKEFHFILAEWPNFYVTDNRSFAVHAIIKCILISLLVDEILLPRDLN